MPRPLAVLRPEPGNAATARRIEALDLTAIRLPLFEVRALAWTPPDPARFDALIITSANAVRHGGAALGLYRHLPVFAVGRATADAARAAGFAVRATGTDNAAALVAEARHHGVIHALHLSGREVGEVGDDGGSIAQRIPVYASEACEVTPAGLATLAGSVALVHSPRAGSRLAELIEGSGVPRATIHLAAIGARAAEAAGPGWAAVALADRPTDDALIAAAHRLAD